VASVTAEECAALSPPNFPNYRLGPVDGSACDTLGIDNIVSTENVADKIDAIKIYPNPTSSHFTLQYANYHNKQIIITDILGRAQKTLPLQSETTNITTQNLANGIYYVSIYANNHLLGSRKFVVLHE
jgi:hypothetical protein